MSSVALYILSFQQQIYLATLLIHFVMRSIFKIRRKTKQIFIVNSWALGGGWKADATFIDLMLFGLRIKNLHKYYITYRGEYSDLRGTKYYA